VYLNPRPIVRCIPRTYPENYYTRTGRHTATSSSLVAAFKRRVIRRRMAPFRSILENQSHVLEIGSGDGSLLLDLKSRYPHLELTGIDMVFPESARIQFRNRGIRFIESRIEDVDLPSETFDLVIMNQIIEHLPDPGFVTGTLARALKPGGIISIETPNIQGYDRSLFAKSAWGGYYFPRHLHLFSRDTLARLLETHGFEGIIHTSLVAPVIWIFSLHAQLCPASETTLPRSIFSRIFTDRSPLALAFLTLVDLAALAMGKTTSNMKMIARKKQVQSFEFRRLF
jgi:2-polyprenyl-3-methyl-5-hydroxy-6-metoxy-1,4-benzoquinol methylase